MIIYSMTATFGKLEHETLTLEPGLNIITAENEWGKSTWCAFLSAMLYGVDTRAKTTRSALADKEHYAPWSGSPMSGRMDLNWQGRDITIERTTRGRQPLGQFRAYETQTGLEIPELTAETCGQQLLGVEKSVFLRSAFVRLQDLPVSDDEALRRRLNNLVTTGDEHSGGQQLARELKEMKNKIRHNRTGLLPQLEAREEELRRDLNTLTELEESTADLQRQLDELTDWRRHLENHLQALEYRESQENLEKISNARKARDRALGHLEEMETICDTLPDRDTAHEYLQEILRLQQVRLQLSEEMDHLAQQPVMEPVPQVFAELEGKEAMNLVREDRLRHRKLTRHSPWMWVPGVMLLLWGLLWLDGQTPDGPICACAGILLLIICWFIRRGRRQAAGDLVEKYGNRPPETWEKLAADYTKKLNRYRNQMKTYQAKRQELQEQTKSLNDTIRRITRERGLEVCRADWEEVLEAWDTLDAATESYQLLKSHVETLDAMVKTVKEPDFPDRITHSGEETRSLLAESAGKRQQLENLMGQYQGKMSAMDSRETLEKDLAACLKRKETLEKTYDALTLAQTTLAEATAELQRRYAPRISSRAQEIMSLLTAGRYTRVRMGEDLMLRSGTGREDTLRDVLWRSDGTVDQLYFALRLAVAEEVVPLAPLVLDDAFVRFDDTRLKNALEVLKTVAGSRQVILFTCQNREKNLI